MNTHPAWSVALASLLLACSDGDATSDPFVPADTLPLAPDPAGAWYAGDLHVHATGASNDTGGDSLPEDIKAAAVARGLSFVVLTDHSNSTGSDVDTTEEDPAKFNQGPEFPYWERAAELSEPGQFWMIDGNEISPVAAEDNRSMPTGHIGCIPPSTANFDTSGSFTDRPMGSVTGGDVLTQAAARGCFTVLNHPYGVPWIAYDWTSFDYDAMEVWNGSFFLDNGDRNAHKAWRCDVIAGRDTVPVGASDNHRVHVEPPGDELNPPLGSPVTSVFAAEPTWESIAAGLRGGDVVIHDGDSWLQLDGYREDGARAQGADIRWLRIRAQLDSDAQPTAVRVLHTTSCDDPRPTPLTAPEPVDSVLLEQVLQAGEAVDWAVPITGDPGVYTAIIDPVSGRLGAMSRAIAIR